jgi:NADH dehydrogenase FAD-containing subunit
MGSRIVIVGAGFAGLRAALDLPATEDVTVVANRRWCEFLPNIHELLSGRRTPGALRIDAGARVRGAGHRFVLDEVTSIDIERRQVQGRSSGTIGYDILLLTPGLAATTGGVEGAAEHALPFKSVDDCARIGGRLRELASAPRTPRIVIVGGGLEGVEALGEILRAFPAFRIDLVEGASRLLPTEPPSLDRVVRSECSGLDVRIHDRTRVERVTAGAVFTDHAGCLESDLTIWTGGPAALPLLEGAVVGSGSDRLASVAATLESFAAPDVFLAGDAAELPRPITKQAYHALDMGTHAAANILRRVRGKPLEDFVPSGKPSLISFGDRGCFLVAGSWALFGPSISLAKEAVFQMVSATLAPPSDVGTAMDAWLRLSEALPEPRWPSLQEAWEIFGDACDLRFLAPQSAER